jgi:aryl-alcohol dehydrogenase-like predicted oxidoreductase
VGRAIKGKRDEFVIATKFGNVRPSAGGPGRIDGTPAYVRSACEASLRRLGIDTIDLYQQPRVDPDTPIEETIGALAELIDEGKIRYAGLSEALPPDLRRAAATLPIASLQSEYSLLERSVEALASAVFEIARSHEVSPAQIALGWLLARRPCIVPIHGARRLAHVEDNALATEVRLTPSDEQQLEALAAGVQGPR